METTAADRRRTRLPRGARRAQLLASALEAFVAQGYYSASMDDIAERAGVSKPVLYQHFPGKLDLYLALLDTACEAVIADVRAALESTTDNRQRVLAGLDAFYRYVDNAGGAFRLVFESDLTNDPDVRQHVDRVTTECAAAIAVVVAEDTGLPAEQAHLLAVGMVGMATVSSRDWLASGRPIPRDEAVELIARLAWRGLRGFPRTEE